MICDKCGSEVPEGGFLCRKCGNDCRGFLKEMPDKPKKLVYKEASDVEKKHVGGFISATEQAMEYGYNINHTNDLDYINTQGNLYNPRKKSFQDEVKPYTAIIAMRVISLIVLIMAAISAIWMCVYAEEVGDVANNVFVTEIIKALAVFVGMIGLSLSTMLFWLSLGRSKS